MDYITEQQALNIPEGAFVIGRYIGDFLCDGIVQSSRCKYGGEKQYTIKLTRKLHSPTLGFCKEVDELLVLSHKDIVNYVL